MTCALFSSAFPVSLTNKLLRIALIFLFYSASLAGQIIVGDSLSAGIIYRNISDTSIIPQNGLSKSIDIDIDADNINDIRFTLYSAISPGLTSRSSSVKSLNNVEVAVTASDSTNADTLLMGDTLNFSSKWKVATNQIRLSEYDWTGLGGSFTSGAFRYKNQYLGFRKISGSDTLYGWFFIDSEANSNNASLTLHSWAYTSKLVGIDETVIEGNKIVICPNPTSEKIFIRVSKVEIEKCKLYTIEGKELHTEIKHNEIDVSFLPQGLYFLQIQTSKGVIKKKVEISR